MRAEVVAASMIAFSYIVDKTIIPQALPFDSLRAFKDESEPLEPVAKSTARVTTLANLSWRRTCLGMPMDNISL